MRELRDEEYCEIYGQGEFVVIVADRASIEADLEDEILLENWPGTRYVIQGLIPVAPHVMPSWRQPAAFVLVDRDAGTGTADISFLNAT